MDWELRVYTPNKASLKATYSAANPGGLLEPFRWARKPSGDCLKLTFRGRPSDVDAGPDDVVHLRIDDENGSGLRDAFYGQVVECPAERDTLAGEWSCLGGREFVEARVVDSRRFTNLDISAIIGGTGGLKDLLPPMVTFEPTFIKPGLGTLREFSMPYYGLDVALDSLVRSAATIFPTEWGVDAAGRFFVWEATGVLSVPFEQSGLRWERVRAENPTTRVTLIIAGGLPEGASGAYASDADGAFMGPYVPLALTHTYQDPSHPTYLAERAYLLPPGVDPFTARYSGAGITEVGTTNISNAANAFDGNESTYAESTAAGSIVLGLSESTGLAYGVEVLYMAGGSLRLAFQHSSGPQFGSAELSLPTAATPTLARFVLPRPATVPGATLGMGRLVGTANGAGTVRVYALRLLTLNTSALDRVAKTLVKLPAQYPARLELAGIRGPARVVNIVGVPGGDVIALAGGYEYEASSQAGFKTIVNVDQEGSGPEARRIVLTARRLDRGDVSDLRAYVDRT